MVYSAYDVLRYSVLRYSGSTKEGRLFSAGHRALHAVYSHCVQTFEERNECRER